MDIRKKLKAEGLKFTIQRKIVYEVMSKLHHASIEDIMTHVERQASGFTPSTVYRILDAFCDAGLISSFNHPGGRRYYDINSAEHHHIFAAEGKIMDYNDPELTEIIMKKLENSELCRDGIERVSIQVFTKSLF